MPHKKSHKKRVTRRTAKKGGYYGFDGAVGTGAPLWSRATEVAVKGGKKHRKSRKVTRRRKGGSRFGTVSASYQGTGSRGVADYVAVDTKGAPPGSSAGGAFNNFGVQPSSA
jgi:hypothetical protein